jgi:hypothetical protein
VREKRVEIFLNRIINTSLHFFPEGARLWDSSYSSGRALKGREGDSSRSPDFFMTRKRSVHSDDGGEEVLDKTKASKRKGKEKEEIESQVVNEEREVTNWAEVPAVAELKTSETSLTKKLVSTDLLSKVLCMFSTQDNRRYALSFSIAGRSVAFSLLD